MTAPTPHNGSVLQACQVTPYAGPPLNIRTYGDSWDWGWPEGPNGGTRWQPALSALLRAAGVPHTITTNGQPGATTADLLQWVPQDAAATKPGLVLLYVGLNDIAKLWDGFESRFAQLRDGILASGAKLMTAFIMPVPNPTWQPLVQPCSDAIFRQTFVAQGGVAVYRPGIVGVAGLGKLPLGYIAPDNSHPTKDGYEAVGREWFQPFIPYLGLA